MRYLWRRDALRGKPPNFMDDAHPWVGIVGGVTFVFVGLAMSAAAPKIQELAVRRYEKKTWWLPFRDFVHGTNYVPAIRLLGITSLLAGLFLLLGSGWKLITGMG